MWLIGPFKSMVPSFFPSCLSGNKLKRLPHRTSQTLGLAHCDNGLHLPASPVLPSGWSFNLGLVRFSVEIRIHIFSETASHGQLNASPQPQGTCSPVALWPVCLCDPSTTPPYYLLPNVQQLSWMCHFYVLAEIINYLLEIELKLYFVIFRKIRSCSRQLSWPSSFIIFNYYEFKCFHMWCLCFNLLRSFFLTITLHHLWSVAAPSQWPGVLWQGPSLLVHWDRSRAPATFAAVKLKAVVSLRNPALFPLGRSLGPSRSQRLTFPEWENT